MLSPSDFVARWGSDSLSRFPAQTVSRLPLAEEDKALLVQAGLPADAAPFLSFDVPNSAELPTVTEQWGAANEFQRYRVIGSDGSGNPIALDTQSNGEVAILDHENRFSRHLMNTTIRQMVESLLAYRKLIQDTQAEFGPDAFLDGRTSVEARQRLREEMTRIDPAAVKAGSFWSGELQNLDANAG
jgi:hypothetical protein